MDDMSETLFYEARLFVGSDRPNAPPLARSTPLAGMSARWGGGPVVGSVSSWWGEHPDLDMRFQYAGYSRRIRTAAGLVISRDGSRGPPEWLEGIAFDLDVDLSRSKPTRRSVWEVFLTASMEDRFVPAWAPGHGNLVIGDGVRWMRGYVGLEVFGMHRFAYEDGASFVMGVAFIGRMHLDVDTMRASRPIALADVRVTRDP